MDAKPRKRGRRPGARACDPAAKRSDYVIIRVLPGEYSDIHELARRTGKTVSFSVRDMLMDAVRRKLASLRRAEAQAQRSEVAEIEQAEAQETDGEGWE